MTMTLKSIDQFDEEPTLEIPRETMRELVYGEGHAPAGPTRPTRNLRPMNEIVDDVSDGIPTVIDGGEDTELAMVCA
jgi:hypothetical protein